MRYVMIVNIGPVQGFIAAARRTRDLWYGSWLLSELSKYAAAAIRQKGGELIFPAVDATNAGDLAPGSKYNVVNRVVALVDGEPEAFGAAVGADLERLLREQWEDVLQHQIHGKLFTEDDALAQVLDLVECTWAAYPCASDDAYADAREKVDELLAARKNSRNFGQVTWGDMRPKSSLDGQRESVIPEDRYPADNDDDDTRRKKADALYRQYRAGRAERLSGVDLLKRHGNKADADKTPSTSHIAARPFITRLAGEAASSVPIIKKLTDTLVSLGYKPDRPFGADDGLLGYDGYLLYENRLQSELEDRNLSEDEASDCMEALSTFYEEIDADPVTGKPRRLRPSPYYALLLGDGDNMGKVVDAQEKPDEHRAISRDLSNFAGEAKSIVGKHQGFTIYAGGDDVMAFVPLHTLLDCAVELHAAFKAAVGSYKSVPEDGATVSPSLSIGIVIAHHLEPLSDVLALAREAEKTAKKHPGKDALAVTLSKRSGADRTVVGGWTEGIAERLRFFMDNVATKVPEGAAYEILHMSRKLTPTHKPTRKFANEAMTDAEKKKAEEATKKRKETEAHLCKVMELEAIRILGRKRGDRGQQEIAPKIREDLHAYLKAVGAAEVANELILASLLAKARQLATGNNGAASAEGKEKVNA